MTIFNNFAQQSSIVIRQFTDNERHQNRPPCIIGWVIGPYTGEIRKQYFKTKHSLLPEYENAEPI